MFRSQYFRICWQYDKTLNTKVVYLYVLYKFSFGQISSAVQIWSEKSTWKSLNLRLTLIPSDTQTLELNNSRTAKNLKKTFYRKLVALNAIYNFVVYKNLSAVQIFGEICRWIPLVRGALSSIVSSSDDRPEFQPFCAKCPNLPTMPYLPCTRFRLHAMVARAISLETQPSSRSSRRLAPDRTQRPVASPLPHRPSPPIPAEPPHRAFKHVRSSSSVP